MRRGVFIIGLATAAAVLAATARLPSPLAPMVPAGAPQAKLVTVAGTTQPAGPTVYLTIDDGPNPVGTPKVLKILQKNRVHATFFVIGQNAARYPQLLLSMAAGGNAIGDHTYDHNYAICYRSPQAALQDFAHGDAVIHRILGYSPQIARAPGGTWGNFSPETFRLLQGAGYRIYNWNVSVGDSSASAVPPTMELATVKKETPGKGPYIVLMHDDHPNTVNALPSIIAYFKARGFQFGTLNAAETPTSLAASYIPFPYSPWVHGVSRSSSTSRSLAEPTTSRASQAAKAPTPTSTRVLTSRATASHT